MKLLPMRIIAQLIDIFVGIAVLVGCFILIPSVISFLNTIAIAVIIILTAILINSLLQLPFLTQNQTIGKAFAGLEIISTNTERPITVSVLFTREVFCKLISCYILCIPLFFGKRGGHEEATETSVQIRTKR